MTTYNTGNPLGSTAAKDLYDNAENFDNGMNSVAPSFIDRFGKRRQTWSGMENAVQDFLVAAGFVFLADYAPGVTLTARNQYVIRAGLPYTVGDSVTLPHTLTGTWATDEPNLRLIGDAPLRADLAAPTGATLVGFGATTVAATLAGMLPLVPSYATLAAAPVSTTSIFLSDGNKSGIFRLVSWANFSAIGAVDTVGAYVVRSITDNSKAWVRDTDYVSPEFFGAVGDDTTNDVAAFRLMFAVAKAGLLKIKMGAKTYLWNITTEEIWDFTDVYATGLQIEGAGPATTNIHIVPTGFASGAVAWRIQSNADWYRLGMKTFAVVGSFDGTLLAVGKDNYADPLNIAEFDKVEVRNSFAAGSNTEAWRINYVVNSVFNGCIGNCYANGLGANYGTALRMRQGSFNTFVNGSFGNAAYAVRFTDGFSYGNVFLGCDHENTTYCVAINSANAGRNTWIGGTFSLWTSFAIQSTNADPTGSTVFKNVNYSNGAGPSTIVDPSNYVGVTVQDGTAIATPSMPASGTAIANTTGKTATVRIWGGAYTAVGIQGVVMSRASNGDYTTWVLPAGLGIVISYTSAPSWSWISPNM